MLKKIKQAFLKCVKCGHIWTVRTDMLKHDPKDLEDLEGGVKVIDAEIDVRQCPKCKSARFDVTS